MHKTRTFKTLIFLKIKFCDLNTDAQNDKTPLIKHWFSISHTKEVQKKMETIKPKHQMHPNGLP